MKIDDCQLFLILVREVNHATAIQIQQRPVEYRNAPGIFILEQCLIELCLFVLFLILPPFAEEAILFLSI